jgi:hypothetical protein
MMTSLRTNTEMAPAMKNAGTRQVSTCSRAYSFRSENPERIAPVKSAESIGMK